MEEYLEEIPEQMEESGDGGPDLLQIYLDEVQAIREMTEEEESVLIGAARSGDPGARDRLTEGYMGYVMTLLRDFVGGPLNVPEMIGVSNLALVKAVRSFLISSSQKESLRDMITRTVTSDLSAAAARDKAMQEEDSLLAEQAGRLTELSGVMAEELGRPASEEELAERMQLPAEEVRSLIRMTLGAIG